MTEIKKEIKQNADGSFTITDAHSTADIVRWLLTQDSKETILYLLKEEAPQRSESSGKPAAWVGLTDDELTDLFYNTNLGQQSAVAQAIALLKERNT